MYRVKRTCLHTGAVSETSIGTALRSAVLHLACHDTILDPVILILILCLLAGAAAFYKRHFSLLRARIDAHDLPDLFRNRSAAHRTASDFRLARHNGRRKTGAAGISAASAVISRKRIQNSFPSLICLYGKFLS